MNKELKLDLEIADLIIKVERKEIDFDTFHRRLTQLEILKECTITI